MEEMTRHAVGIDVGTENVRVVMAEMKREGVPVVVGYAEVPNSGMRKGEVVSPAGPAAAIDKALGEVEKMSGVEVKQAVVSINGEKIVSRRVDDRIGMGDVNHEVGQEDIERVKQTALNGRVSPNYEILEMVPLEYNLDGQGGIRQPLGMFGARLELVLNVILAVKTGCETMRRMLGQMVEVQASRLVPEAVAAGRAVLSEKQMENGVAVMNFGAATTSVAVFDEGELQTVFVVPLGAEMITKDLANVLEINMETAEELKRRFVTGAFDGEGKEIVLKQGREEKTFKRSKVDETARARMEDIFGQVAEGLKQAGHSFKLPEGMVMVGGGAKMRGIELVAKEVLHMAVRIGTPKGLGGMAEEVAKPEYATAVGLLMSDDRGDDGHVGVKAGKVKLGGGWIKQIFSKF